MIEPNTEQKFLRRIKSFVKRDGRLTDAQNEAFENHWQQYGINLTDDLVDFEELFARKAPTILEIGFGSGFSLLEAAKKYPENNYIGIETHKPGLGCLIHKLKLDEVENVKVFYADAVEVLNKCIKDSSLAGIQLFFPDPWPKRKHHKRRIIQPEFVKLLASKLQVGGELHLATDWEHYAMHMMQVLTDAPDFVNTVAENCFAERSEQRPIVTKFEKRGKDRGHGVWELLFKRK